MNIRLRLGDAREMSWLGWVAVHMYAQRIRCLECNNMENSIHVVT